MDIKHYIKFIDVTGDWHLEVCANEPTGSVVAKVAKLSSDFYKKYAADAHEKDPNEIKKEMKYLIQDLGEMFIDPGDDLKDWDKFYTSRGSISVSEFLLVYRGGLERIMKRGRIKNDDEARTVNGLLCAVDADITSEQREKLNDLLYEYEKPA